MELLNALSIIAGVILVIATFIVFLSFLVSPSVELFVTPWVLGLLTQIVGRI